MTNPLILHVEPSRAQLAGATGIYVRAKDANGTWGSYDIAQLDKPSLLAWLSARNDITWTINVIGVLLGHGHLTP